MNFIGFFNYLSGRSAVVAVLSAGAVGCGGGGGSTGPAEPGAVTRRDIRIVHQSCPIESGEKLNLGGDARPDVVIVKSGGRESCRALDMNFDGVWDSYVYRDGAGSIVRRENDYDRDGRVDEIAIYGGGVLTEKQRATTLVGRLDTWHFYKGGNLARTERDSDGDTLIDQWWEYPKADRLDCPLIHSDIDGDGRPDTGATVDVCGESSGYVPPEKGGKGTSTTFERGPGGALPTEVEEKPSGAEQKPSGAEQKPSGDKPASGGKK